MLRGAMSSNSATLIGSLAILLWSLLALFTVASGEVPPFQLAAMTFAIGGTIGALTSLARRGRMPLLRQPASVWSLGVSGLFGSYALYFAALRLAPPAEAGLINYLWPLLIVLFSASLPGERLKPMHIVSALLGFAGVAVLMVSHGGLQVQAEHIPGYLCALACAFLWAGYSVLSRRFGAVPTDTVTGFCLATALLSFLCHLAFERTVWPADRTQWLAVAALGIGPVGAAFYVWDIGVKQGDIRLLGVLSYATPVLSTLILVVAGYAEPSPMLAEACALIVLGAVTATLASQRTINA